jgi:hypothetical protein
MSSHGQEIVSPKAIHLVQEQLVYRVCQGDDADGGLQGAGGALVDEQGRARGGRHGSGKILKTVAEVELAGGQGRECAGKLQGQGADQAMPASPPMPGKTGPSHLSCHQVHMTIGVKVPGHESRRLQEGGPGSLGSGEGSFQVITRQVLDPPGAQNLGVDGFQAARVDGDGVASGAPKAHRQIRDAVFVEVRRGQGQGLGFREQSRDLRKGHHLLERELGR